MPGFYPEDEYDLAGFAVGVVDEKDIVTGAGLVQGDVDRTGIFRRTFQRFFTGTEDFSDGAGGAGYVS